MNIVEVLTLLERRKNPEQNPKISPYKRLKARYSKSSDNTFISFTEIDKLGINPKSVYSTPLGIYSYPAKYVLEYITDKSEDMGALPFAGNNPYVNIFEGNGNIVDLNNMVSAEAEQYYKKMKDWVLEYKNVDKNNSKRWKEVVDMIENIINDASDNARYPNSVGGRFWYVTMNIVKEFTFKPKAHIQWNHLFRYIGVDGCIDNGTGIIHGSEPWQAVFFSKRAIKNNERMYNKWSGESIIKGQYTGLENKIEGLNSRDKETEKYIMDAKSAFYAQQYIGTIATKQNRRIKQGEIPEDIILLAVKSYSKSIRYIENPSERVQLAAVKRNSMSIKYIKNPTEKVKALAKSKGMDV